jgi:hypothetical protein
MGHTNIRAIVEGTSPSNAYNKRYNEDLAYYGHQEGYSGHFNAFEGLSKYREQLVSSNEKFTKAIVNEAEKIIDKAEDEISWDTCYYIDLGIIGYQVRTIKKVTTKGSYKEIKYVVRNAENERFIQSFESVTQAKSFAKKYADDNSVSTIVKREFAIPTIEKYVVEEKIVKTKPTTKTKKVEPVHKYYLFGCARE